MIAIIPARGNSQRIPGKNIRIFRGQPIICYSIETARDSELFDKIIVSTDDDLIASIALEAGAEVHRRPYDDGTKGTQEVARDVLCHHYNDACVIYPTSPLLEWVDLALCYAQFLSRKVMFAMSVADPLADAGCFYFGKRESFMARIPLIHWNTMMYPLPPERVCDINTQEDWEKAERMFDALRRA